MNALLHQKGVMAAAAIAGSLAMLPATQAAVLYDVDFLNDPNPAADWTPLVNEDGWGIVDGLGYRYLRGSGAGGGAPGLTSYTGNIGDDPASNLDHYVVESYFSKSQTASGNFAGVVARLQDATNYYMAVFDSSATLRITRVLNGTETSIGSHSPINATYTANALWRISLSVVGNVLEANVYDGSDVLVGSASAIDNNFTDGTFGLRANVSANHNGAFQMLTVTGLDFEPPEPILVANPASGYVFDLGEFDLGESILLPGEITLSNDGTGFIQRTGFQMTGSGLFDIQGLIREGTTIGEGASHNYDIAFFGSEVAGVYEALATFTTSEGEISYTLRATVVPEPAAISLLGLAGLGLMSRRMRRLG